MMLVHSWQPSRQASHFSVPLLLLPHGSSAGLV
jgi:hypothetical protein